MIPAGARDARLHVTNDTYRQAGGRHPASRRPFGGRGSHGGGKWASTGEQTASDEHEREASSGDGAGALRAPAPHRAGWDGHRLGRASARDARVQQDRGHQDHAPRPQRGRSVRADVPRRGRARRQDPPPQRRRDPRPRRAGRDPLHRHGVGGRRGRLRRAQGDAKEPVPGPHPPLDAHRHAGLRRPPRRPRAPRRERRAPLAGAPRRLAAEHPLHLRRHRQARRLRRGQGRRSLQQRDQRRPAQGQGPLHVARAGARRHRRPAHRHLRDGHRALQDDDGDPPLPRGERPRHDAQHHLAAAPPAAGEEPGLPAGRRAGPRQVPPERPGEALPDDGRARAGDRAVSRRDGSRRGRPRHLRARRHGRSRRQAARRRARRRPRRRRALRHGHPRPGHHPAAPGADRPRGRLRDRPHQDELGPQRADDRHAADQHRAAAALVGVWPVGPARLHPARASWHDRPAGHGPRSDGGSAQGSRAGCSSAWPWRWPRRSWASRSCGAAPPSAGKRDGRPPPRRQRHRRLL